MFDNWMRDKVIETLFPSVWHAVAAMFEHNPIRIGVSAVLLVAAVISGKIYVDRTKQYQEIVPTTIRSEGEGEPQRFGVLEAFIMSTIDAKLTQRIENATISDEFSNGLRALHKALSAPGAGLAGRQRQPNDGVGVKLSIPNYINSVESLPLQNAIITDNTPDGCLFYPLNLLRAHLEKDYRRIFDESKAGPYSRTLAAAVATDRAIADDIDISRKLLQVMQSFTTLKLFKEDEELKKLKAEMQPTQVYYITKNGLNRIVNNTDAKEQQIVYRNMFRSSTFFPSRPYYVGAFKRPTPATLDGITGSIKQFFYVSQPYLDIGGFGVVITLALPIRYKSHNDAAICFDLCVHPDNEITFQLKDRLRAFGAASQDVICKIGFLGRISCGPDNVNFSLRRALEDSLNDAMRNGDLSAVVGNINILDDQTKREDVSQSGFLSLFKYPAEIIFGHSARPITFAISLTSPNALADTALEAQFMISSLNLERFQEITSLLGLGSVSLLALAFFVVLSSWYDAVETRRNYQEAFKTVDAVLKEAPTAYCRLDANDIIVDCNSAFCNLLNISGDAKPIESIKGRKFEELVAEGSKASYREVQKLRRTAGVPSSYPLILTFDGKSLVKTQITGGVIPGRTPRELPETFGIVIPVSNPPSPPTVGVSPSEQSG